MNMLIKWLQWKPIRAFRYRRMREAVSNCQAMWYFPEKGEGLPLILDYLEFEPGKPVKQERIDALKEKYGIWTFEIQQWIEAGEIWKSGDNPYNK